MAGDRLRAALLIAIATCALVIIAFSFLSWVEFDGEEFALDGVPPPQFSLAGTEVSRTLGHSSIDSAADRAVNGCTCRVGFGDGYFVAILGGVVLLAAAAALVAPLDRRLPVTAVIVASLAAFTIAGYNAIADWEGVGRALPTQPLQNLDGEVRFELYVLTATAALAAVLGAVFLATMSREPEPLEENEEAPAAETAGGEEANEAWARGVQATHE